MNTQLAGTAGRPWPAPAPPQGHPRPPPCPALPPQRMLAVMPFLVGALPPDPRLVAALALAVEPAAHRAAALRGALPPAADLPALLRARPQLLLDEWSLALANLPRLGRERSPEQLRYLLSKTRLLAAALTAVLPAATGSWCEEECGGGAAAAGEEPQASGPAVPARPTVNSILPLRPPLPHLAARQQQLPPPPSQRWYGTVVRSTAAAVAL